MKKTKTETFAYDDSAFAWCKQTPTSSLEAPIEKKSDEYSNPNGWFVIALLLFLILISDLSFGMLGVVG